MVEFLRPISSGTDRFIADEQQVLDACLVRGRTRFASGAVADNKLNFDFDEVPYRLQLRTLGYGLEILNKLEGGADFFAGVPNGGRGWSANFTDMVTWPDAPENLPIEKVKDEDGVRFYYGAQAQDAIFERRFDKTIFPGTKALLKCVVVEDVASTLGTSEKLADHLKEVWGIETMLILSMFFRGKADEVTSKYPRATVYSRHIPLLLGD